MGKKLKYLFIKYPWLWLFTLFILPLLVGWIAYDILTYAGNSPKKQSLETLSFAVEPITNVSTNNSNSLPLWLMLAIAFCCASGCLVIFIILHNSQPIKKTSKRIQKRE